MSASAALLSLRSFNLFTGWPELAIMSCEEVDEWLKEKGLLWTENPCPVCQKPRKITKQSNESGGSQRWKFECHLRSCRSSTISCKSGFLKGTFFENLRSDRKKFILFSYLYVSCKMTQEELSKNCEIGESTVVQWGQYLRDVMAEEFNNPYVQIGGPGTSVQIDETNIVRRKHNVGRMVRSGWLVGGIQDGSRAAFVEITAKRTKADLEAIIQRHVLPGTTLITDCWAGYNNLANLGYLHHTVNHSLNFVDPTTGYHTQRIECLWSQMKRQIKPKCGLNGDHWDDHWFEALWRFKYHEESKFYELWSQISKRYPLT